MINIKRFIDKVTAVEGKNGKSVVLSIEEARSLRDELSKMLADNYELLSNRTAPEQVIQIELAGGKF